MNKLRPFVLVSAFALAAPALADPPGIPQLFSQRASVTVPSAGIHSLELPVEIVKSCKADLSDLRLWNGSTEVPYAIDSSAGEWKLSDRAEVKVGNIAVDTGPACASTSGSSHCETMELGTAARGEGWTLVFEDDAAHFVERVQLSVGDTDETQSIYRLEGGPPDRLRFTLPALPATGTFSVTLVGAGKAPPAVRVHLERGKTVRGGNVIDTPLRVITRWHDRAGSHILLERPRGLLPSALRFDVKSPTFDRAVTVYDSFGTTNPSPIGIGKISRVAPNAMAALEQLEVPLGVSRAPRLEVVIDDGNSPPLEPELRAVLEQPVLLFDAPQGELTLFFGGGRAETPRYDFAGLLPQNRASDLDGVRAEIAARLHARDGVTRALLGAVSSNSTFDPTPALTSLMHPGGEITTSLYAKVRPLTLTPSPDGLSRYQLAPSDLAAARSDFSDIRVVDAADHQWSYLLDREVEPTIVEGGTPSRVTDKGVSRYTIALPATPFTASEVDLDIAQPFFERSARVLTRDEAGREDSRDWPLSRSLQQGKPTPILITAGFSRISSLVIEVTDGGDAPLDLTGARLVVPAPAIVLPAKPGAYRLFVGDPANESPTYELVALRATIEQLDSIEASAGALVDNPAFSRAARLASGGSRERLLVWLVLAAAVLGLGALALKLAKKPDEPIA